MRHFLLPFAILLCSVAPALAQVTVDLHALDALPRAPGSPPGRRSKASRRQALPRRGRHRPPGVPPSRRRSRPQPHGRPASRRRPPHPPPLPARSRPRLRRPRHRPKRHPSPRRRPPRCPWRRRPLPRSRPSSRLRRRRPTPRRRHPHRSAAMPPASAPHPGRPAPDVRHRPVRPEPWECRLDQAPRAGHADRRHHHVQCAGLCSGRRLAPQSSPPPPLLAGSATRGRAHREAPCESSREWPSAHRSRRLRTHRSPRRRRTRVRSRGARGRRARTAPPPRGR